MRFQRYGPYGAAAALAILTAGGFLLRAPREFPIDDAYIHFVYAENLADGYGLTFNRGEFSGLGTTSILWVLVLAGFRLLGVSVPLAAKLLGIVSLATVTAAVYGLAHQVFTRWLGGRSVGPALFSAALVALSGNMIWFSLSGMETTFFLAWGFLALTFYARRQFVPLGIALGLLALTRVEGILLAGVIVLLEVIAEQQVSRSVGIMSGLVAACLIPWMGYVFCQTGHLLPTSFAGKKAAQMMAMSHIVEQLPTSPVIRVLLGAKPMVYLLGWISYLGLFVLGAGAPPGRLNTWYRWEIQPDVDLSLGGLLGVVVIALPLLARAARFTLAFVRQRSWQTEAGRLDRPLVALLGWLVLHNLAYLALLPNLGTASRYGALNHVALWMALAVGVWTQPGIPGWFWGKGRETDDSAANTHGREPSWAAGWFWVGLGGVVLMAGADFWRWSNVYASNIEHMKKVRIAAAEYVDRILPPQAPVAAHDIGAVKYFSHRRVIDLGGLIDTAFVDYLKKKRVKDYLRQQRVDYLVIPEGLEWYDYLGPGHLNLRNQKQFDLIEVQSFEIDRNLWLTGSQPTWNALPAVRIYRLDWHRG